MVDIGELAKTAMDSGLNKAIEKLSVTEVVDSFYNTLIKIKNDSQLTSEETRDLYNAVHSELKSRVYTTHLIKKIDQDSRRRNFTSN